MKMQTAALLRRRAFLQGATGLGVTGLLLPHLARAQTMAIPKRLVIFYGSGALRYHTADGFTGPNTWEPRAISGQPRPTEQQWQLAPLYSALAPYKSRMVMMRGLGMVSELGDTAHGNAHQQGEKHALCAMPSNQAAMPGGPSFDQFVARRLNSPTALTPFRSLELAVGAWGPEGYNLPFAESGAGGAITRVTPVWDPRVAYDRVLGAFPTADPQAQRRQARRAGMLGLLQQEFGGLSKLSRADKQKLDAHQTLIRDLEQRLQLRGTQMCSRPADPRVMMNSDSGEGGCDLACYDDRNLPLNPPLRIGWEPQQQRNWDLTAQLHTDLAAAALACDLTRVVSLAVEYQPDQGNGFDAAARTATNATDWHDLVHKMNITNEATPEVPAFDPTSSAARAGIPIVQRMVQSELAVLTSLLRKLEQIPEADGSSLLDNTVVLVCGQIGYGSHSLDNLPWYVVGGQWAWSTDRYYDYDVRTGGAKADLPTLFEQTNLDGYNYRHPRGVAHNRLFVSLANAMGVETNTFGDPRFTGRLRGL